MLQLFHSANAVDSESQNSYHMKSVGCISVSFHRLKTFITHMMMPMEKKTVMTSSVM